MIKVQGVVVSNEWLPWLPMTATPPKEGKTTIYNGEGIFSTTGNTTVSKEDCLHQDPDLQCQHSR